MRRIVDRRSDDVDESLIGVRGEISRDLGGWGDGARNFNVEFDLTIGSALDIFGGTLVCYDDVVALNCKLEKEREPK